MIALHVSYVAPEGHEWIPLGEFPLTPSAPSLEEMTPSVMDLANQGVTLPNGESLRFSVGFAEFNLGMSVHVQGDTPRGPSTLLFFGGFKSSVANYDPTAYFLSPGGLYVQIMVGPATNR